MPAFIVTLFISFAALLVYCVSNCSSQQRVEAAPPLPKTEKHRRKDSKSQLITKTCLVLGRTEAGKTTFTERLKKPELINFPTNTISSRGLVMSDILRESVQYSLFEVAGRSLLANKSALSPLAQQAIKHSDGVIVYIVDAHAMATMASRAQEEREAITKVAEMAKEGTRFIVLANKQDQKPALGKQAVVDALNLNQILGWDQGLSYEVYETTMNNKVHNESKVGVQFYDALQDVYETLNRSQ